MRRVNLHNHTTFSDGALTPAEVVEAARAAGLDEIGISDHYANRKLPPERCVRIEDIAGYADEVRGLGEIHRDRIGVRAGIEVAFSPLLTDLSSLGLGSGGSPLDGLDYVLFEYVEDRDWEGLSLLDLVQARRGLRPAVGLAHPDLASHLLARYRPGALARLLAESEIFVELCPTRRHWRAAPGAQEARPSYRAGGETVEEFFREVRRMGVGLSIGTDTHEAAREVGDIEDAMRFVEENGLEGAVVTGERLAPRKSGGTQ